MKATLLYSHWCKSLNNSYTCSATPSLSLPTVLCVCVCVCVCVWYYLLFMSRHISSLQLLCPCSFTCRSPLFSFPLPLTPCLPLIFFPNISVLFSPLLSPHLSPSSIPLSTSLSPSSSHSSFSFYHCLSFFHFDLPISLKMVRADRGKSRKRARWHWAHWKVQRKRERESRKDTNGAEYSA